MRAERPEKRIAAGTSSPQSVPITHSTLPLRSYASAFALARGTATAPVSADAGSAEAAAGFGAGRPGAAAWLVSAGGGGCARAGAGASPSASARRSERSMGGSVGVWQQSGARSRYMLAPAASPGKDEGVDFAPRESLLDFLRYEIRLLSSGGGFFLPHATAHRSPHRK